MKRIGQGLLALLLVIGLALAVLLSLPASERGSRWLLGQVPGLSLEGWTGPLYGHWTAERLSWTDGRTALTLEQPRATLRLSCLWQRRLCVDELQAAELALTLPPADASEPAAALPLPQIHLPLEVQIGRLALGRLLLQGNEQLRDLALSAQLTQSGLHLSELTLRRDALQVQLKSLTLQPHGDWPLQARATLQLPAMEGRPWQIGLELEGNLAQRLELQALSSGYLQAELGGWLVPLEEGLPLALRVQVSDFLASASLPPTLRLSQLTLEATGDLQQGFAVQGRGQLAGRDQPVALNLAGRVDAQGAQIEQLRLRDAAGAALQLSAQLGWQEALSATLRLQADAFDWQQLYPLEGVEVGLQALSAQLEYAAERYRGDFDIRLQGPAGPLRLHSPLEGSHTALRLPALRLEAGSGHADGTLALAFTEGLGWDAALKLADLDPAYWLADLPGRLGGQISSRGRLQAALQAEAQWNLQGHLRRQPLKLAGHLQGRAADWQLDGLDLQLGDNRLHGQGRWASRLEGRLDLALKRLDQLWPGLRGNLNGDLQLAGTPAAPQGQLNLNGRRLGYLEAGLARLSLAAVLEPEQRGRLQFKAERLRSGDTAFGTLSAQASGTLARHGLALQLQGEPLAADLRVQGGLDRLQHWRGELARAQLAAAGLDWQLQAPARLERTRAGQINLGAHCWQSDEASLCAEAQRLLPDPQLRLRLRAFQLARLAALMPEGFAMQGLLEGDVSLDLAAGGPAGRLHLDAGQGLLRLREFEGGRWQEIAYQSLYLDSRLRAQRIDSQLQLSGPLLGELALTLGIDPRPGNRPLSGNFRIAALDLALARPFIAQIEQLEGRIDGGGQLSGSLLAPVVNGQLRLREGRAGGGDLPLPIEDLQLSLDINGQQARVEGHWRSGEHGRGSLEGELGWASQLAMVLNLRGSRLPASLEPYAEVEVEPDLQIALNEGAVSLSGRIAVPRGRIRVRELPEQAVRVSEDARIVGAEEPASTLPLRMDLRIALGAERLSFAGFGLTADLKGNLRIRDNLDSRGTLTLENGRYRAYGQRLTLRRARLLFAGPVSEPLLDIEAVRTVGDVTAGLRLSGRSDAPLTQVFSDPAMSQEQALSYLVLGRPLGSGGDDNMVGQAALALGLAGGAPVARSLADRLGIQDFQLESEGSGLTSSVVASGYLAPNLSLRYGVGVFEPVNSLALRYELSRKLYLEAASGLASSLDIFYKRDY
ncbi:translocation/assembly module TamB domain-containing protein [Pseudomonas sp. NW5]|uniref:translocation/assembly module TamB domain-containing protein n=1 Tax=Pseudomonas sp. NW5 TaxID=2934934 RepID=UPI002020B8DE|nr:translocation/assembly module TamB domain-containing protein [Pseudomonas sp. NW5]MCL7463144.1 translocation/assembly module TamB [Pseudomonas sp. NW5]